MANLDRYKQKRNFANTSEPKAGAKKKTSSKPTFTVQRHHASRLHYDFRLEVQGVLKSWAVPKGPSLNPKDRRLAVQVEDHPLSYGSFEGSIPKGNYGAGTVTIFDSGTFDYAESKNEKEFLKQLEEGSIKFTLHGKILRGGFALVRMKTDEPDNWLLIKHQDDYALDKAFNAEDLIAPAIKKEGKIFKEKKTNSKVSSKEEKVNPADKLRPMLAKLTSSIPKGSEWIFEQKYDGFRALAVINKKKVKLISRNGKNLNSKFPSLVKDLEKITRDTVIDGEIIIEDKQGKPYFQLLQSGEPIAKNLHLRYYIFDLISLDENDLSSYALSERKELLKLLLKKVDLQHSSYVDSLPLAPDKVMDHASSMGWEGIIVKMGDSPYMAGKRSDFWQKLKGRNTQEAIICGFTAPQGGRSHFGALVLGVMDQGDKLLYIGNCGTGFNERVIKDLYESMIGLKRRSKPFSKEIKVVKESSVTWLSPKLVCEVYYAEWTRDGHLRHPAFKGLREDKTAKQTRIEIPQTNSTMEKERKIKYGRKTVSLTNQDKVYWPKEGIKKGDMLSYYESIAEHILPYLKDKPISMNRFPNGINGQSFFQKDVEPDQLPSWIKTTPVHSESGDKMIDYILCNDPASLLFIANLGSIEINPWLASYKKPEKPQFAVLDLDPNGADFQEVIAVARSTHKILKKANIPAFIKTSGSTGLHIYMNVNQRYEFEIVRDFVQLIAEIVNQQHPETTSVIRDPKKRKNLIYLDYLQNKKGQTIAAPYSVRPKPGATVSTPLSWKEVNEKLTIADYDIFTIPERIKKMPNPWENIWKDTVDIKKSLPLLS